MANLVLNLQKYYNISVIDSPYLYHDISIKSSTNKQNIDYNANSVKHSLSNLFSIHPGERILNPAYGSNLERFLYSKITDSLIESIKSELQRLIQEFEPRITITDIESTTTDENKDNNEMYFNITYTIPALAEQEQSYILGLKQ